MFLFAKLGAVERVQPSMTNDLPGQNGRITALASLTQDESSSKRCPR